MGHRLGFTQPRYGRDRGTSSNVEENAMGTDCPFTTFAQRHPKRARADESAIAKNELVSGRFVSVQMHLDNFVDHLALACVNSRHIDGCRSGLYPELLMPPYERGDFRGVNHILARQAGDIHARATDISPLDDSGPHPFLRHSCRHPLPAGAAAKNDDVKFVCCLHTFSLRPRRPGRRRALSIPLYSLQLRVQQRVVLLTSLGVKRTVKPMSAVEQPTPRNPRRGYK